MRKSVCQSCGQEFPMSQTVKVVGRLLCVPCAQAMLSEIRNIPANHVQRQVDPTVCARCGTDNGDSPLPTVAAVPMCADCTDRIRNYPFPTWVKLSFVGLLALVVASLVWNMRFLQAHFETRRSGAALAREDYVGASEQMNAAAEHVPEVLELRVWADYLQAIALLEQERFEEALPYLRKCDSLPFEYGVAKWIKRAEMSVAFDTRDYDQFLAKAREIQAENPGEAMATLGVASALACKYAVTGEDHFRQESLDMIDQARATESDSFDPEYVQRIRHRLHSREIIQPEEFVRRFPNGWEPENPEQDPQP